MKTVSSNVIDWLRLAQEASRSSRSALAFTVADFWADPAHRLSDHERALMRDILERLLKDLETRIRTELAERLSRNKNVPEEVVALLADSDIDLAGPVLLHSPVLRDEALIDIIRRRTREHRLAIAARQDISAEVASALTEHEDDVLVALALNSGAALSRHVLDYLVAESERLDALQEPLIRRQDLPPDLAHRMFWWVSAALRQQILDRYTITDYVLDDFMEDVTLRATDELGPGNSIQQRALAVAEALVAQKRIRVSDMPALLRQGRYCVVVAALSQMTGISSTRVERLVSDLLDQGLAVLLRQLGAMRSEFASLFLLLDKMHSGGSFRTTDRLEQALALFDRLDPALTGEIIRLWSRHPAYQQAQEQLAEATPFREIRW